MRKIITSGFILILLLLSLWGVGAWYMGTKTAQNIQTFIQNSEFESEGLFHYELLSYDRSLFNAKAKVKLSLNKNNVLTKFLEDLFANEQENIIKLDILHGPLFFDTSGVSFGSSALKLVLENQLFDNGYSKLLKLNHTPTVFIAISFKESVKYRIPIKFSPNEILITGTYDLNTSIHNGTISAEQLIYQDRKQKVQITQLDINYQQLATDKNNKTQLELSATIPELFYTHQSLTNQVAMEVNYKGNISIENNTLNNYNNTVLKLLSARNEFISPIEKGHLTFNINSLDLGYLSQINFIVAQLKDLQQQSQWLLEEQGEFPEGQDQIRQTQDLIVQYSQKLPQLVKIILNKNSTNNYTNQNDKITYTEDTSRINFSFDIDDNKKQSKLSGAIYPATIKPNEISPPSLLSLIQIEANVSLDDQLFQFLSILLPLEKEHFKLIYRQNMLLMQ